MLIVIGAMAMGEALAAIEITLDRVTQRQTCGGTTEIMLEKVAKRMR